MTVVTPKPSAPTPVTSTPNVRGTLTGVTRVYVDFSRSSGSTVRFHIARGAFELHLAPGAYGIRLVRLPQGRIIKPASVRVPSTGVIRLRLVVQPKP
jgi:hypothetical protein